MRENKSKSVSSVSVRDFGIDDEKPLLASLNLTRVDPNCYSHEANEGL